VHTRTLNLLLTVMIRSTEYILYLSDILGICLCNLYVNIGPRETSVSRPYRPHVCWRFLSVNPCGLYSY